MLEFVTRYVQLVSRESARSSRDGLAMRLNVMYHIVLNVLRTVDGYGDISVIISVHINKKLKMVQEVRTKYRHGYVCYDKYPTTAAT